jgi:hypothetical protein
MLTSIIPKPPEKIVSDCVRESVRVAQETAVPLVDRRPYYWLLIHYYATKLVTNQIRPRVSKGKDPGSQYARRAIRQINTLVDGSDMDADQTDVFYKELHRELSRTVKAEERKKSETTAMLRS